MKRTERTEELLRSKSNRTWKQIWLVPAPRLSGPFAAWVHSLAFSEQDFVALFSTGSQGLAQTQAKLLIYFWWKSFFRPVHSVWNPTQWGHWHLVTTLSHLQQTPCLAKGLRDKDHLTFTNTLQLTKLFNINYPVLILKTRLFSFFRCWNRDPAYLKSQLASGRANITCYSKWKLNSLWK